MRIKALVPRTGYLASLSFKERLKHRRAEAVTGITKGSFGFYSDFLIILIQRY